MERSVKSPLRLAFGARGSNLGWKGAPLGTPPRRFVPGWSARWRPGPSGSTARRGVVVRDTATLIFVGAHMSGIRRELPLTTIASMGPVPTVHRCFGGRFCCGGAPACCGVLGHELTGARSEISLSKRRPCVASYMTSRRARRRSQGSATGRARTEAKRRLAAALDGAEGCGRPVGSSDHLRPEEAGQLPGHRRSNHALYVLARRKRGESPGEPLLGYPGPGYGLGAGPGLAGGQARSDRWAMPVGPGGLDQLGAQMDIARLGHRPSMHRGPRGALGGDKSGEAGEVLRLGEAAKVADLGGDVQSAQAVHSSIAAESQNGIGEGCSLVVEREVFVDAGQIGFSFVDDRQVAAVAQIEGFLTEAPSCQPAAVLHGPVGLGPNLAVAQEELGEAVASPGEIADHVRPGPTEISHGLFGGGGHPDADQLAGSEHSHQPDGVTVVGLDLVAWYSRNEARSGDHAGHAHRGQPALQVVARGPGLIDGPKRCRRAEPGEEPPDRLVIGADSRQIDRVPAGKDHRRGDGQLVDIEAHPGELVKSNTGHGTVGSFQSRFTWTAEIVVPLVAPATRRWLTHEVSGHRSRPFHPDYAIRVNGVEVARGEAPPATVLAIGDDLAGLPGTPTKEPVFGLAAKWVPAALRPQAELAGATVVDPPSVITTHLAEVVRVNAGNLLTRGDVKTLVEMTKRTDPTVVEELGTASVSLA